MKRFLSILLVFALLLSGCTATSTDQTSASSAAESLPTLPQRADSRYDEMVFVRPDLADTIAAYEDFTRRIRENPDQIFAVWEEEADLSRNYLTMHVLAQVRFSQDTTNLQYTEDQQYMQDFLTNLRPAAIEFTRAILAHPDREMLEREVGAAVLDAMQTNSDNYAEEQIRLDLEVNQLVTQYTQLMSQDVVLETEEHDYTISDLYYFMYQGSDEDKAYATQLLQDHFYPVSQQCGEIFDRLVTLRTQKAQAAGFEDYLDYYYDNTASRGYGRAEIESFRQAVKTYMIPLYRRLKEDAETRLGRSLDLFDYTGPLPAQSDIYYCDSITGPEDLMDAVLQVLRDMSPETREMVDYMQEHQLYDLIPSSTKAAGAFTTYFYEWQQPFVISNYDDAGTYIHEFGHALNFFRAKPLRFMEQDLQGADISEIHSQALELLAEPWLDQIYDDPQAAQVSQLFDMFFTILSATMVDEFQHAVYENPDMTHRQRCQLYRDLQMEYFGQVNYRGLVYLEEGCDWVEIMHLFESPMYYVEYAITAVAAMGFWQQAQSDWDGAFSDYLAFLDLPNQMNLPDSLATAHLPDVFSQDTIKALAEQLEQAFLDSYDLYK